MDDICLGAEEGAFVGCPGEAEPFYEDLKAADSTGPRAHVLAPFALPAEAQPAYAGRQR